MVSIEISPKGEGIWVEYRAGEVWFVGTVCILIVDSLGLHFLPT